MVRRRRRSSAPLIFLFYCRDKVETIPARWSRRDRFHGIRKQGTFFSQRRDFFLCSAAPALRSDLGRHLLDHDCPKLNEVTVLGTEKRIVWISLGFVLVLLGLAALAIHIFHVGLPTCLSDVTPFQKGELIAHSPTHYELHYVARMWKFEPEDVAVPAGSTVDIYLSAADVTHGMILLGTNLNLMAVPGVVNYARVKFDHPHDYQLLCHEFCGTGHDKMAAELRVVDAATFRARLTATPPPHPAGAGYQVLEAKDCLSCHSIDGQESIGPTLKGIYGRKTKLADGSTVVADAHYLREAILNPDAQVVAGFDPVMPKPELTEEEVEEIIEYLETLK
jgi:cytochrome c oxidase subunit II